MLNFSANEKTDTLIPKLQLLKISDDPFEADFEQRAKSLAVDMVHAVESNGASVNLRVNHVKSLGAMQIEIQIIGHPIK